MARGRHPHAYVTANAEAARRAIRAIQERQALPTVLEAVAIARAQGHELDNPVSGPEYEQVILTLHKLGIKHNMSTEAYTLRIVASQGDYAQTERPIERLERQHGDIWSQMDAFRAFLAR